MNFFRETNADRRSVPSVRGRWCLAAACLQRFRGPLSWCSGRLWCSWPLSCVGRWRFAALRAGCFQEFSSRRRGDHGTLSEGPLVLARALARGRAEAQSCCSQPLAQRLRLLRGLGSGCDGARALVVGCARPGAALEPARRGQACGPGGVARAAPGAGAPVCGAQPG